MYHGVAWTIRASCLIQDTIIRFGFPQAFAVLLIHHEHLPVAIHFRVH
jgi:hypothetical protein